MGHIVALLELLLFSSKIRFLNFIISSVSVWTLECWKLKVWSLKLPNLGSFFFKSKGIEAVIETDDK